MKINQLKAGVVLSYVSETITVLSGLIYTPIMLRLLGQSEYGLYQLSASVISYLSLLSMGFGTSYIRYYSRYKIVNDNDGIQKLNGMFMSIFMLIGVICLLAGGVLIANVENIFDRSLSPEEIDTSRILMAFMIFNLAISFPGSVFSSHITANEQYIFQRVVNIARVLLNPFLTLPLLLAGYKSIGVVFIQTVLAVAALVINVFFAKKKLGMKFSFKNVELGFLKELFMFSFWIFLNQIIDQVNNQVDKFILGIYSGTTAVAIYGVANQISTMYLMFAVSISSVFTPRINRMVADKNDNKELTDLFTKVGRIQFILLFLIASGFVVFGRYFIGFWAGEGYEDSYVITMLLIIPMTVPLIQQMGIDIQYAKNKHQTRTIIYLVMAIINVALSIPIAKLYGGIGAALGTCISYVLGNGIAMNIVYQKVIGINIVSFWRSILSFVPGLIAPLALAVVIMQFIHFSSITEFGGWVLLYICVYIASMWLFALNDYEKDLVRSPLKKLLQRHS